MVEWLNWTEGNISCKDGLIKGQKWYGPNRTEAEDIKRWQEYTEELYKKDLHDQITMMVWPLDSMITHLEPDILEWEVKWALGSITTNKASGGDRIPVELFQILKDGAVKVLHSICQQIWKLSSGLEKISFHSNPKEVQFQRMFRLPHNCTHFTC